MMRAVDAGNLDGSAVGITQWLDVLEFEFVVVWDVEMERAAERDIEDLQSAADGEERQAALGCHAHGGEFPRIACGIGVFDQAGIRDRLMQVFAGNIAAAGEEQAVDVFRRRFSPGVPETHIGMGPKDPLESGFVAFPNPCGDIFQSDSVTRKGELRIILLE